MKKAARIVSYLLVFTLVTSLFSAVGGKEQKASANVTAGIFTILEIVPHEDMGTVGYLVPDTAFENYYQPKLDADNKVVKDEDGNTVYVEHPEVAYMTRGGKSKSQNAAASGSDFYKFLVDGGYGTYTLHTYVNNAGEPYEAYAYSSDYFATNVLAPAGASGDIKLLTRTPGTLKQKDIDAADMIIINETVPNDLKVGTGTYNARFEDDDKFTWEMVYAIFKKIAGVESDPVPYVIDGSMGRPSAAYWDDVRTYNITNPFVSNKLNTKFSAIKADQVDIMENSSELGQELDGNSYNHMGSNKPSFKLFKLLSAINPATLYGLYFVYNDDSYGIDPITGDLIVTGVEANSLVHVYALGDKYSWWGDKYLWPLYLGNSSGTYDYSYAMSQMNWLDSASWDYTNGFRYVIGKDENDSKGNGIAYKDGKGIFSLFSASSGGGGVDLSSFNDIGDNVSVTYSSGNFSITNKTSASYNNWKVSFKVSGLSDFAYYGSDYQVHATKSGNVITFYSSEKPFGPSGLTSLGGNLNPNNITIVHPGSGSSLTEIAQVVKNIADGTVSNDYHPYNYLIVTGHNGSSSVGASVNRSVIAEMVNYANENGKGLVGGLRVDCVSDLNFAGLSGDFSPNYDSVFVVDSSTTRDTITDQFETDFDTGYVGVSYSKLPAEYYSGINMKFRNQDGAQYYPTGTNSIPGNKNFINDDDYPAKRSLDFKFKIIGSGTYEVKVYVDKNGDDVFAESESVTLSPTSEGGKVYDTYADLNTLLEKDFVGGFAWKLVITPLGGSHKITKVGYSAIRKTGNGTHTIKILQIVPTDYTSYWGTERTGDTTTNPFLLIPTKSEVAAAGKITEKFPSILATMTVDSTEGYKYSDSFLGHFSGKMSVRTSNLNLTSSKYNTSTGAFTGSTSDVPASMSTLTYSTDKRSQNILSNAALLEYYIENLSDFDIDCDRYSVYDFNKAVFDDEIVYYPISKKIGKTTDIPIINDNADDAHKQRYLYDPAILGVNTTDTVNWGGTSKKKYLADEATGWIYGERESTPDTFKYYGANEGGKTGTLATKKEIYDLVVIGFGSDMDYMSTKAIDTLADYIDQTKGDGNVLIGNGVVTYSPNNTLGNRLRNMIGMSDTKIRNAYGQNGKYEIGAQNSMITNDTLYAHYPYKVAHYFKTTASLTQFYSLDLSKNPVVSFAKYASDQSAIGSMENSFSNWGDVANNYYLYKYGNITFCGFGQTMANPGTGQRGGVLSLTEDVMLVNALVISSKFRADGFNGRAFFDCIDVDRSVLMSAALEDDELYNTNLANIQQHAEDAVYTDYNSFGLAASVENGTFVFDQTLSDGAMNSLSIRPSELGDKVDSNTSVRWIPYMPTIADASYNLVLETKDGKPLALDIYEYDKNSKTLKNSGNPISANTSTTDTQIAGAYKVKNNIYFIGVPLYRSGYPSGTDYDGLGFELGSDTGTDYTNSDTFEIVLKLYTKVDDNLRMVESHDLTMVRRVVYPVD